MAEEIYLEQMLYIYITDMRGIRKEMKPAPATEKLRLVRIFYFLLANFGDILLPLKVCDNRPTAEF